ncbi:MAG: hypothetical protein ABR601_07780 [Parasphingopyxis sp.]|nr:hypothetical protein [Sphingomonadales bacterium]
MRADLRRQRDALLIDYRGAVPGGWARCSLIARRADGDRCAVTIDFETPAATGSIETRIDPGPDYAIEQIVPIDYEAIGRELAAIGSQGAVRPPISAIADQEVPPIVLL